MTWAYSSRQYGLAKQLRSDWLSDFTEQVDRGELEEHPFAQMMDMLHLVYRCKNEEA